MEAIRFEVANTGVATITLARPEALNAINPQMIRELHSTSERLSQPDVRVVIFRGEGRAFSAGADITQFRRWTEGGEPTGTFRTFARTIHDYFDFIERLEKPVIAAISGACVGGGLELAISCDIRIASTSARFGYPENNIGLIPNSGGCSRTMRLIGPGLTKLLVFRGHLIGGDEARRIGLIESLVSDDELDSSVDDLAAELAAKAPQALGLAKYAIDNAGETDRATGRYIERLAQSVLIKTDDHAEGVEAFLSKRKPKFQGS